MKLSDIFIRNNKIIISAVSFPFFIKLFSGLVGLVHVGYLVIMYFSGMRYLALFNVLSVLIYSFCFFYCTKPSRVSLVFYLSFSEIILFVSLTTLLMMNVGFFCILLLILIPLAFLLSFWQKAIYEKRLFRTSLMVCFVILVFFLSVLKITIFPGTGLYIISVVSQNILNVYTAAITVASFIISSIAFTTVSTSENEKRDDKYEDLSLKLIAALSQSVEAKDEYTKGHSSRVAKYSRMIATKSGWSEEDQKKVYYAGLLHDVGKIGIADEIINKKGRLTDEEFEKIKTHTIIGERILKDIKDFPEFLVAAKSHHERYDGRGYPEHLIGEMIPDIARIIGVADSYDAMTSNRSYRSVMPQEAVREQIQNGLGTQFDPFYGRIMLEIIAEDKGYLLHE